MDDDLSSDLEWCRHHFALMADGGVWIVPRSGIIFRRHENTLILVGATAPPPGWTEEEQREDAMLIMEKMTAAGIHAYPRESDMV